jgi:hypothetical protein
LFAVKEFAPVPPLATDNVPVTPVVNGNPVALVKVPEVGVPKIGVTSVGLVLRTFAPVPVSVVTPVPPFATGNVPVTPVVSGNPVALVKVPEVGVPKTGVTNVGLVFRTLDPVPVPLVTPVPPFATANVPDKVTAPVVPVLGVNPVLPALKLVTAVVSAAVHVNAEPVHFKNVSVTVGAAKKLVTPALVL